MNDPTGDDEKTGRQGLTWHGMTALAMRSFAALTHISSFRQLLTPCLVCVICIDFIYTQLL